MCRPCGTSAFDVIFRCLRQGSFEVALQYFFCIDKCDCFSSAGYQAGPENAQKIERVDYHYQRVCMAPLPLACVAYRVIGLPVTQLRIGNATDPSNVAVQQGLHILRKLPGVRAEPFEWKDR